VRTSPWILLYVAVEIACSVLVWTRQDKSGDRAFDFSVCGGRDHPQGFGVDSLGSEWGKVRGFYCM
jgi:hypothetical protein